MITLRKAQIHEYDAVRSFYHRLIDMMEDAVYKPAWEKDVYPANQYMKDAIAAEQLYVGFLKDNHSADGYAGTGTAEDIICAMVINNECNDSYADADWQIDALPEEVTVIHTLGVLPSHFGKGIATEMVRFVIDGAKAAGQKAVRLDVLAGNLPAERLYSDVGFKHITTIPMFYEDTGWTDFLLYEYLL